MWGCIISIYLINDQGAQSSDERVQERRRKPLHWIVTTLKPNVLTQNTSAHTSPEADVIK